MLIFLSLYACKFCRSLTPSYHFCILILDFHSTSTPHTCHSPLRFTLNIHTCSSLLTLAVMSLSLTLSLHHSELNLFHSSPTHIFFFSFFFHSLRSFKQQEFHLSTKPSMLLSCFSFTTLFHAAKILPFHFTKFTFPASALHPFRFPSLLTYTYLSLSVHVSLHVRTFLPSRSISFSHSFTLSFPLLLHQIILFFVFFLHSPNFSVHPPLLHIHTRK